MPFGKKVAQYPSQSSTTTPSSGVTQTPSLMKRLSSWKAAKVHPVTKHILDKSMDNPPPHMFTAGGGGKALEQYKVKELREIASKAEINLKGLTRKADIIKKIKAAR
jgi:hypothetical protein